MKNTLFFLPPFVFLIASCASVPVNHQEIKNEKSPDSRHYEIQGSFTYREETSLPENSVAIVTLNDISRADSKAITIAKQEIDLNGKSAPIKFELIADADHILHNMQYAVRIEIRNQYRDLLWTTDTVYLIDTQATHQVLHPIRLKRIVPPDSYRDTSSLIGTKWYVIAINNNQVIDSDKIHLKFAVDGNVSGSTGCNNFSGKFAVDGENLSFSPLASTRKSCIPRLNDQERNYIQVLNRISRYRINNSGQLILIALNEEEILAVRSLSDSSE